ncbi:hypothetical protein LU640_30030, partial [Pseudomonas monteilii]|uniref:hypothetical protein n=1 Tax=Pseudomonas monteilii TaxID=76759 RepID=UPI001E34A8C8
MRLDHCLVERHIERLTAQKSVDADTHHWGIGFPSPQGWTTQVEIPLGGLQEHSCNVSSAGAGSAGAYIKQIPHGVRLSLGACDRQSWCLLQSRLRGFVGLSCLEFRQLLLQLLTAPGNLSQCTNCSGLLTPDTFLGENGRHTEVFDEQTT